MVEVALKLLTTFNIQFSGVSIYTYQHTDLGLARTSVQIVFLRRFSFNQFESFNAPLPPLPPPKKTARAFEL